MANSFQIRKLHVFLVDDENPAGTIDHLQDYLNACLGMNNYEFDYAKSFDHARMRLSETESVFDLILLDLRLDGEHQWGGAELLVNFWNSIQKRASEVILYSAKADVVEAYRWFNNESGPFLFIERGGYNKKVSNDSLLGRAIIQKLRHRVRRLTLRASPSSVAMVRDGQSDTVFIEGQEWSVDSLLSPWHTEIKKTGGISPEDYREKMVSFLFRNDDYIRTFSWWFKQSQYAWPSETMYGLSQHAYPSLFENISSGALDALTHSPLPLSEPSDFTEDYRAAATRALQEIEFLYLTSPFLMHVTDYIKHAQNHGVPNFDTAYHVQTSAADEDDDSAHIMTDKMLVQAVRFEFRKIIEFLNPKNQLTEPPEFLSLTSDVPMHTWKLFLKRPYYGPAYPVAERQFQPAFYCAAKHLARSLADRAAGEWAIKFALVSGDLRQPSQGGGEMPYVQMAVCVGGKTPLKNESVLNWFIPGHDLNTVRDALRGTAQWFILIGEGGKLWRMDAVMEKAVLPPGQDTFQDTSMWQRYNPDGRWRIVHVFHIGLPTMRRNSTAP